MNGVRAVSPRRIDPSHQGVVRAMAGGVAVFAAFGLMCSGCGFIGSPREPADARPSLQADKLFQDRPAGSELAIVQVGDDCDSSGDGVYVYWKMGATVNERDELLAWFSRTARARGWEYHRTLAAPDLFHEAADPNFVSVDFAKRVDRPEAEWGATASYSDGVFVVKLRADTECTL